jgi:hypothetical protein
LENSQETDSNRLSSLGDALAALANDKMQPQAATEMAKSVATALENPQITDSGLLSRLGTALAALLNKMEPLAAANIASRGTLRLAAALENPQITDSEQLSRLGTALAALLNKMGPLAAAKIASRGALRLAVEEQRILDASKPSIINTLSASASAYTRLFAPFWADTQKESIRSLDFFAEKKPVRLSHLDHARRALVRKMQPMAAPRIAKSFDGASENPQAVPGDAKSLAAALENPQETDSYSLSRLANALTALADKMEPHTATEIAKGIAIALENPQETNANRISSLGHVLIVLSNKMEPQAATEIAMSFAAALENTQITDLDLLSRFGNSLAALANTMQPRAAAEIASRGAKRLTVALEKPQEINSNLLQVLAEALTALANKMGSQAAEIAKSFATALENPQITDSEQLWRLGQSLAAVCRLLPSAHRTHLLALSNMLLQPVSIAAAEGKEQPYDRKLLADVCAQLRTEDLAQVLKYPFCTGEAEQIVLNQLNSKTHRDFDGYLWKFVEEANSLGIKDIDDPTKRPSVPDALKELDTL